MSAANIATSSQLAKYVCYLIKDDVMEEFLYEPACRQSVVEVGQHVADLRVQTQVLERTREPLLQAETRTDTPRGNYTHT